MRKHYLLTGAVLLVLILGSIAGANAPVALGQGPVETQLGVILDGSASMSSTEWTTIKNGLASAVENPDCFPKDGSVELTVVQFGDTSPCRARLELGPVVIDSQTTANNVGAQIRGISKLGGDSCLHHAIDLLATTMATAGYYNTGRRSPTANSQWLTYPTFSYATWAYTQNNSGAQADDNGGGNDDYHQYYGYGFNIPSNAVIDGIQVRIRNKRVSYGESKIRARLSWDGGSTWTSTYYTTPRNYNHSQWYDRDLGGSSAKWGHTWTPSEINSGFRVRLRALDTDDKVCYIDWVAVRVYYHVPSNFHPDLKQMINIVTNSDPWYWKTRVETARDNLLTTLQMTEAQDEIDLEFFGTKGATSNWY